MFFCVLLTGVPASLNAGGGGPAGHDIAESEKSEGMTEQTAPAGEALRRLLSRLEAFSADFEQQVIDTEGYELQSMSGHMVLARPGKIYWQTKPPYEQLLVSDANTLWLYDKDLEQVTVRPFLRDVVNSPAMLLIGDLSSLESDYRVSYSAAENGDRVFNLTPMDSSAVYQKLMMRFAGDTPVAMVLWDSLGQESRITFSNINLNPTVSESLFRFEIPEGVDVLYDD